MLGLQKEKLQFLRSEALLVLNLGNAPWSGAGHFGKYGDAAREYAANHTRDDDLFLQLYEALAFSFRGGKVGEELGSRVDQRLVFADLVHAGIWEAKGEAAKSGRWFQFTRRWQHKSKHLTKLLFIIAYMGLHLGWWPCLAASPLSEFLHGAEYRAGAASAVPEGGDAPADDMEEGDEPRAPHGAGRRHGAGDPGRSLAAPNAVADKLAADKNSLFLASRILANN